MTPQSSPFLAALTILQRAMLRASLLTATYMEVMNVKQNKQSYQVGQCSLPGLGVCVKQERRAWHCLLKAGQP